MFSTGDKGIDNVIGGLCVGDNVVWQLDSIDVYKKMVLLFSRCAKKEKKRLVYIRFGSHEELLKPEDVNATYELDPSVGFESFSVKVNSILASEGPGVFYVFDCLSDLLSAWSNDLMIGNFFKVTCPFLFEIDTIAYFSILRNSHSFETVARIRGTTQVLIDIYTRENNFYIHPLKVWDRHSPTMFLPHVRQEGDFRPITSSSDTARLFSSVFTKDNKSVERKLDSWDRLFLKAEKFLEKDLTETEACRELTRRLLRLIISRDEKILTLARDYLKLEDILNIRSRMIGTGFIGGKTLGMLLARNILLKENALETPDILEPHDSFYVGADVFYTYIVENGWWQARLEQRSPEEYFRLGKVLEKKMLKGKFPGEVQKQFKKMLDYFGQSPIIVRSSSLLEDGYGNAFAGKYESVFLSNQGSPQERYEKFIKAVATVYASTMSREALAYRLQRGLDKLDEQMALLVQRVSGSFRDKYFFPDLAGVGLSHNIFTWKKEMDANAGMLRIVLGLGTRAVDRVDGDYPRIVALDRPLLKAQTYMKDLARFSQHEVDVINLEKNVFETVSVDSLLKKDMNLPLDLFAVEDVRSGEYMSSATRNDKTWVLTFDELFAGTDFGQTMRKILHELKKAYNGDVDIEFAVNFKESGDFHINILQCRPQATRGLQKKNPMPAEVPEKDLVLSSSGNFMGGNLFLELNRIVYVDPERYCRLSSRSEQFDIARAVGVINRKLAGKENVHAMLLGPGRWGTSTPSLGVPVTFSEINNMSVLGEIAFSSDNVMPELSYGSHFFQDLVESGIFYLALFPDRPEVYMKKELFGSESSLIAEEAPEYSEYSDVIKIFDLSDKKLHIYADINSQKILCCFAR